MNRGRQFCSIPVGCFLCALLFTSSGVAQDRLDRFIQRRTPPRQEAVRPAQYEPAQYEPAQPPQLAARQRPQLRQTVTPEYQATIKQHHSQLVTSDRKISRIAVTAPDIVNFVQYSEKEVALIGLNVGSTDMTLWFENSPEPVMYEVTVISGTPKASSPHAALGEVGQKLQSVFPRSRVKLIPVADQVVVKGQSYDAAEAEQIMQIVQAQFGGDGKTVVNMLRVPGEFQVMLRVRIAELNRTQLRKLGVTCRDLLKRNRKSKSFGPTTAGVSGVFDTREVGEMMRWLSSNGTISYLAEPSLTVLSGHSASFLSGGEYAVPTVIRDGQKRTEFRNYGTKLKVTPTVLDRDLIRLQVSPEFSQIDEKTTVDGVPGTNVRRVETVVELREGQTIAIGGLVSRQIQSQVSRKPSLRPKWFSRQATEGETELLIVVTPEIVRPMDPSDVPPMPNYYVTHPSDTELFVEGRSEGQPHPRNGEGISFGAEQFMGDAQYGSAFGEHYIPAGNSMPQSILPSESITHGPTPLEMMDQPSSGERMFDLPQHPGVPMNSSSPYGPPQPPVIPDGSGSKPLHIYPDSPPPSASHRRRGAIIRAGHITEEPAAQAKPIISQRRTTSPIGSGHSLPSNATSPKTDSSRFRNSTRGAVIRPVGSQRTPIELPPAGHSIPSQISSKESTSGQGRK
jgi:pilus assembly protein CpaC